MSRPNRPTPEPRLPLAGFRRHLGLVKRSAAETSPRPEAGVTRSLPLPDYAIAPATKARGR